ncbi:MAG: hypothetical protein GQ544_04590, partial [Candidatus Aminicenantes bacterium]|nr:hypothetical protein [Candidatus Aminicenantes bacterium]
MTFNPRVTRLFLLFCTVGLLCLSGRSQQTDVTRLTLSPLRAYRIAVPANIDWTDTGFDVRSGQSLRFKASGGLTLQQG